MSETLQIGARVHVMKQHRKPHYVCADKGTVIVGPYRLGTRRYYLVAMDDDAREAPAVFTEEEIETDM
jgi:hypothetical protein